MQSQSTGSGGALMFYVFFTTIYYILKYNFVSKDIYKESNSNANETSGRILFGIYIVLIIIGEFFINLSLSTAMCKDSQTGTALITTLIPWCAIYGLISMLLNMFPGWLKPFSNTFGYFFTYWFDIQKVFLDSLKEGKKPSEIALLKEDPKLLINELPFELDKFKQVVKQIGKFTEDKDKMNDLFNLVMIKKTVAEYIWYILIGSLVTSISYNYVINSTCESSVDSMKKIHKQYMQDETKKMNDKQQQPSTNYVVTD